MKKVSVGTIALLLCIIGNATTQDRPLGVTLPYSAVQFKSDEDVKCLKYAVESGDPEKGPSTHILTFPQGCAFPWHYHTAEEQMLVIEGKVSVEMNSSAGAVLGPGGFAMMPSKESHQFSCKSSRGCRAFVHFDRAYDIQWGKK